jgi:hypothetical protein
MTSALAEMIVIAIEKNSGVIHGVETLALELNCNDRGWLRELLRRGEEKKQLVIIRTNGGRGRKNIIKRNRNSGGACPRKVRSS